VIIVAYYWKWKTELNLRKHWEQLYHRVEKMNEGLREDIAHLPIRDHKGRFMKRKPLN
jgi:hypothetical protein